MTNEKEWELETRIIHLEGGGLENLMTDFNSKIDSIFSDAITKLNEVNKKPKAKETGIDQLRMLAELSRSDADYNLRTGDIAQQSGHRVQFGLMDQGASSAIGLGMFGGLYR